MPKISFFIFYSIVFIRFVSICAASARVTDESASTLPLSVSIIPMAVSEESDADAHVGTDCASENTGAIVGVGAFIIVPNITAASARVIARLASKQSFPST